MHYSNYLNYLYDCMRAFAWTAIVLLLCCNCSPSLLRCITILDAIHSRHFCVNFHLGVSSCCWSRAEHSKHGHLRFFVVGRSKISKCKRTFAFLIRGLEYTEPGHVFLRIPLYNVHW